MQALRQARQLLPDATGGRVDPSPDDAKATSVADDGAPFPHLWEWLLSEANERKRREVELAVRVRQQVAVAQLGQHALAGGAASADLLDQAVREIAAALDVQHAEVLEIEEGGSRLVLRAGVGWPAGSAGQARAPAGKGSQGAFVLESEEATVVADLRQESRFQPWQALCEMGVVSGIGVRVAGRGHCFGLLAAHTTERRRFSEEDVAFVQAMANVLSEAFQREKDRRQLESQAQESRALAAAIDAVVGEARLDEVLRVVVREAAGLVSSERAVLFLYEEAEGALVPRAWRGYDDGTLAPVRVRPGEGLPGQVYATGCSRADELEAEGLAGSQVADPGTGVCGASDEGRRDCQAAVPVRLEGRTLGTLTVSTGQILLGQAQLSLLERLAEQSAVAIELARWSHELLERNRQLEEEIANRKLAEEALLRSSRLIALGEMSAGMAHELNQPLTVISAVAEGLLIRLAQGIELTEARQRTWSQDILEQVERMGKLIEHLRMFSRDQSSQPESSVALNQVVESALGMTRTQLRSHGVVLELQLADGLPALVGDQYRLEEVVLNLIGNARDALDDMAAPRDEGQDEWRKSLIIRTHARPAKGQVESGAVVLEVQDTGTGIKPEDEVRLFEPFFTTKDPDRGTGLGLSISHAIVRDHGGRMECETRVGEGSLFRIVLPISGIRDELGEGGGT